MNWIDRNIMAKIDKVVYIAFFVLIGVAAGYAWAWIALN